MKYYEVLVASQRFHGDGALTYSCADTLKVGQVVLVPLQKQSVVGVISRKVSKPAFDTKNIDKVLDLTPLPKELLELVKWLKNYYPAPFGQLLTLFLPSTLGQQSKKVEVSKAAGNPVEQPPLTKEQTVVTKAILSSQVRMHLIHGETGSGKTRVYTELISSTFKTGRSVILLTPEIGLTSQLSKTIEGAFPGQTIVLHSNLTPAERRNRWYAIIKSTAPLVVIGPRSALFAPLHDLGLIILDEAHDSSYKQEQAPYYQTSRVAAMLGELHNSKVILGSATPLVADYYTFEQKRLPIHRMVQLATSSQHKSHTKIIDIKDRDNFSKSNWLATDLLEGIEHNLSSEAQSLLFLNRRGSARVVLCQKCGWQSICPNCDVTLTFHADSHRMLCHSCGFNAQAPSSCPVCQATDITFKSLGTKAVANEVQNLFPNAKILRLDGDNLKDERLENRYDSIKTGEVDIIVGTQVIAKGLDLPKLGLVGVVLADTGLNFPDYSAEERTFQLLSQVIGRANRGHRDTEVILQTFNPGNATISFAITKNFEGFYKSQITERKLFGFPPFKYLLKLRIERTTSKSAEKTAQKLSQQIREDNQKILVSQAMPAFIEKKQNRYRWQIIIKSSSRSALIDIIENLPPGIKHDIDPSNLL